MTSVFFDDLFSGRPLKSRKITLFHKNTHNCSKKKAVFIMISLNKSRCSSTYLGNLVGKMNFVTSQIMKNVKNSTHM